MKKIAAARSPEIFVIIHLRLTLTIFFIMMLDLDPCIEVTCYHYGHCKAVRPHDARCVIIILIDATVD